MNVEHLGSEHDRPVGAKLVEVFDGVATSLDPTLTILISGPGAAAGRATARLLAETNAAAILRLNDLHALLGGADQAAAKASFDANLRFARLEKLPAVIDDHNVASSPNHVLSSFKRAGFSTRVVVAAERDSVSALAAVARRVQNRALGTVVAPNAGSAGR